MAILDTIYYIVFIIIVITLAALYQPFAGICPELVTILTTGLVTLRLGYTVKAGTENWKKISQNIRDTKENFTDSLDEGSSEEETEEEENG